MNFLKPKHFLSVTLMTLLLVWSGAAQADHVNIYLVYSADVRQQKNELKKVLSSDFRVKAYNVDLLSVADYSGRQKIMAKLTSADVIVLIGQRSRDLLNDKGKDNMMALDASAPDPAGTIRSRFQSTHHDHP